MDNKLKRMLFLIEYENNKNKKMIIENAENIFESKQTEQQTLTILKNANVVEPEANDLINKFKSSDTTKNQNLLPLMAKSYLETGNQGLRELLQLYTTISDLVNANKIPIPQITNNGYVIKDKTFPDYLRFLEYIHGLEGMSKGYKEYGGKMEVAEEDNYPIEIDGKTEWNNISVYDGNHVGRCIKYTIGGLTGKAYGFCIGQPANSMWQSYRDTKTSTFYYVVDRNRDMNDPLHIVVVDHTKHGFELTDSNNNTGEIAEYGEDANAYLDYLSDQGVPVDEIFLHQPKTPDEEAEQSKLGKENENLDWFKNLSYEEKSKYIGRGHLLGDKQFKYLWEFRNDKGAYKLLHQYVDTGQAIPENQFNILVGEQ